VVDEHFGVGISNIVFRSRFEGDFVGEELFLSVSVSVSLFEEEGSKVSRYDNFVSVEFDVGEFRGRQVVPNKFHVSSLGSFRFNFNRGLAESVQASLSPFVLSVPSPVSVKGVGFSQEQRIFQIHFFGSKGSENEFSSEGFDLNDIFGADLP